MGGILESDSHREERRVWHPVEQLSGLSLWFKVLLEGCSRLYRAGTLLRQLFQGLQFNSQRKTGHQICSLVAQT